MHDQCAKDDISTASSMQLPHPREAEPEGLMNSDAGTRIVYLPIELDGAEVLVEECKNNWRATTEDDDLISRTSGLAYRKSKNLDDRVGFSIVTWGTLIYAIDEGDGWVRIS